MSDRISGSGDYQMKIDKATGRFSLGDSRAMWHDWPVVRGLENPELRKKLSKVQIQQLEDVKRTMG